MQEYFDFFITSLPTLWNSFYFVDFSWKSAIEKGTLNIDGMKLEKTVSSDDSKILENNADLPNFAAINISISGSANSTSAGNDYKPAKKDRRSNSRDLVFRYNEL